MIIFKSILFFLKISLYNLSILPNAEMAKKEYVEKYKLETVKAPIVNMHGSLDETPADNIYETQELVISTKAEIGFKPIDFNLFCNHSGLSIFFIFLKCLP